MKIYSLFNNVFAMFKLFFPLFSSPSELSKSGLYDSAKSGLNLYINFTIFSFRVERIKHFRMNSTPRKCIRSPNVYSKSAHDEI